MSKNTEKQEERDFQTSTEEQNEVNMDAETIEESEADTEVETLTDAERQSDVRDEVAEEETEPEETGVDAKENDDSEATLAALKSQLQVEEEKRLQAEDKYYRLLAEFENFKRRTKQETTNKLKYAQQPLAIDFLAGLDNLERALSHEKETDDEHTKELIKGVEMVYQQLQDALKKHDFIKMETKVHDPFDPNHHEAMGMVESEDVKPNHVALVFQDGYMLYDRVIRPAMVQVAQKK